MNTRKTVLVSPAPEFEARSRFFTLLARLYPVEFTAGTIESAPHADGIIAWPTSIDQVRQIEHREITTLLVSPPASRVMPVTAGRVEFSSSPALSPCFRNQEMIESGIGNFAALIPSDHDSTLCTIDSNPYWCYRTPAEARVFSVALGPPALTDGQTLYHHFNRLTWLRLLPFLHFVKELTREFAWTPPPMRACLIFDDPNLHWASYGFINFRDLGLHAAACNYHAAFAMVPADAWYYNNGAAQAFRDHAAHLSILMHGNNHVGPELGDDHDSADFTRHLAQALRRIEHFERRSGLKVARVMIPPHGALRARLASALLQLNYEAASVSRSSLTSWNKEVSWLPDFGHGITEFIGDGFPIIPRQVLARCHEGSYRLAAFLDQPIVPHGHHFDCAKGLDLVAHTASVINGLGPVIWSDMATLSRTNYLTRQEGDTLFVRMLSRTICLPPPDTSVRQIIVERPWMAPNTTPHSPLVCRQGQDARYRGLALSQSESIAVSGRSPIRLFSPPENLLDPRGVESPTLTVWPVVRRLLAETRDRMAPLGNIWGQRPA